MRVFKCFGVFQFYFRYSVSEVSEGVTYTDLNFQFYFRYSYKLVRDENEDVLELLSILF